MVGGVVEFQPFNHFKVRFGIIGVRDLIFSLRRSPGDQLIGPKGLEFNCISSGIGGNIYQFLRQIEGPIVIDPRFSNNVNDSKKRFFRSWLGSGACFKQSLIRVEAFPSP